MPVVIFGIYSEDGAGKIVGLTNGATQVARLAGDDCISHFASRASKELAGARILFAVYQSSTISVTLTDSLDTEGILASDHSRPVRS